MRKNTYSDPENARGDTQPLIEAGLAHDRLPNRLMTVFEVAAFVGCHAETIRRAYWRRLLTSYHLAKTQEMLENLQFATHSGRSSTWVKAQGTIPACSGAPSF
jgi:hypothetical protein